MNLFARLFIFCLLFFSFPFVLSAQYEPTIFPNDSFVNASTKQSNQTVGNYLKKPMEVLDGLEISGYYRFLTNVRYLSQAYPHLENQKTTIFVGDDTQIPQFMLNIKGHASSNTEFGCDLYMWTPLTGAGQIENVRGLNLGAYLYGNFSTELGNFTVKTGGINWYALSPFTFQTNKGYNRYSLFERNPWDPMYLKIDTRYAEFYKYGAVGQDERWGNQAFQGLIVEGAQLPEDFSFSLMYGKTQFDGGLSPIPNTSYGGKIMKKYGQNKNFVAFNTFNNRSQVDSIKTAKTVGFNMGTIEFTQHFRELMIYGEVGMGRTFSDDDKNNWGEAISIKLDYSFADKFPTQFHFYRISPKVFNNSSVFINSSIQQNVQTNSDQTQPVLIPLSCAILPMGQLSNNRTGIEINTEVNIGGLKNSIGYGNSVELESLSSNITYTHVFNNLSLSRFWRWDFPDKVGPYGKLTKIYRNVYQNLAITNLDPTTGSPFQKNYFNTIEISSKYQTTLFGKELFLFYLGSLNSIQTYAAPFVVFTEKALLRTYEHQFETYLQLNPKLIWCNYFAVERVVGNYDTEVDQVSKRPVNQTGYVIATGFDITLSKNVGLYVRERWMDYHDSSYSLDAYRGWETIVELVVRF